MHGDYSETGTATDSEARETADSGVGERAGILVEGETPARLPQSVEAAAARFEVTTRTVGFECSSGTWLESEWTGVSLEPVLEVATIPPATTHVLVGAADGYRACVAVRALAGAMVAYGAVDRPESDFPRFVSPSVVGPRAVKNLASLRPVELDPTEEPADYEELHLEEK
jgi:hypothetical protein